MAGPLRFCFFPQSFLREINPNLFFVVEGRRSTSPSHSIFFKSTPKMNAGRETKSAKPGKTRYKLSKNPVKPMKILVKHSETS